MPDNVNQSEATPARTTYSTLLVVSVLIFSLSWSTQVLFWGCRIFDIPVPVFRPTARYVHVTMIVLSTALVHFVGRKEFDEILKRGGRFHVTGLQSAVVAVVIVFYACVMMWALDVIP